MTFKIGFSLGRPAKSPAPQPRAPSYHAVSVRPGPDACQAALDARRPRVLSREAPRLPLEGCDRPDRCECHYQHFDDRRDRPRRRDEGAPPASDAAPKVEERRCSSGRRNEDYPGDDAVEEPADLVDTYYGYRRRPE